MEANLCANVIQDFLDNVVKIETPAIPIHACQDHALTMEEITCANVLQDFLDNAVKIGTHVILIHVCQVCEIISRFN